MHHHQNHRIRCAVASTCFVLASFQLLFLTHALAQEKLSSLETARLRIAYTSLSGNMAPLWMAVEKAYFKEYGLTVEQLYTRTVSGIQAILSGDVQLIYGACAQLMSARRAGADLVLIASTFHYNPYALVSRYRKTESKQLLGKRIAINQLQDAIHISARLALQRIGVSPDAVTYVPIGSTPDRLVAVQTGLAEAAVYGGPLELPVERGLYVLVDLFEQKLPYCGGGIGISENFLKKNPRTVEAFLRGFLKGNAYYFNGNTNAVKTVLAKIIRSNVTDKRTDQIYQWVKNNAKYPVVTPEGVAATIEIAAQQDRTWLNSKPELFYDDSIIKKLEREGFLESVHRDVR